MPFLIEGKQSSGKTQYEEAGSVKGKTRMQSKIRQRHRKVNDGDIDVVVCF